jgi:PadR family transcriptional regulator PadR
MAPRGDNKGDTLHPTGDMLNAHLLAMLKGWTAYGYELVQKLDQYGVGEYNKGSIYRALRQMEQVGLVTSMWDTSKDGPARRMYSLTFAGTLFLQNWLALLDVHRDMLKGFMNASKVGGADDASDADGGS